MAGFVKRVGLAAVVVGASLMSGCNPGALSYFLMPETPLPAKLKHIASKDKKVEPKVVILTYSAPGQLSLDFIQTERLLPELLARHMQERARAEDEKLAIMPSRRVEEFKNTNPEWRNMDLAKIGRKLGADYVIYLEINNLSLYETGSGFAQQLFRGRANITMELADVKCPDECPRQEHYSCTFPGDNRGPVQNFDIQPAQFRQMFLTHVARDLSRYFSNYPRSDNRMMGDVF